MALPLLAIPTALDVAGKAIDALTKGASSSSNAASGASNRKITPDLQAKLDKLDPATRDKLTKTADDFESVFLETSLNQITSTAGENGPLGENGTGGGNYRSMLTDQYAKSIVKSGGIGVSNAVMSQMIKMQEAR